MTTLEQYDLFCKDHIAGKKVVKPEEMTDRGWILIRKQRIKEETDTIFHVLYKEMGAVLNKEIFGSSTERQTFTDKLHVVLRENMELLTTAQEKW